MVFHSLFDDKLVSALATSALGIIYILMCYTGYAVAASPVFRALLLNPASRKKMTKEFDGMFYGNAVFLVVLGTIIYYYVLVPALSGDVYGDATRTIARRDSAEHFSRLDALLLSQPWPGFSLLPRIASSIDRYG